MHFAGHTKTNALYAADYRLIPRPSLSPVFDQVQYGLVVSFPGSLEREMNTRGEPGIFSK